MVKAMDNLCLVRPTESRPLERSYSSTRPLARNTYFVGVAPIPPHAINWRFVEFAAQSKTRLEAPELTLTDSGAERAFKRGASLLVLGVVAAAGTLLISGPLLPIGAGACMFLGGIVTADAVERIRSGR